MGKRNDAFQLSTWTTGAGIAIGTDIDIAGLLHGSAPTTVTVLSGTTILFSHSGAELSGGIVFATTGPINATSSGGSFAVIFRKRTV